MTERKAIVAGQVWRPTTGKRAMPRRVVKTGTDISGDNVVWWEHASIPSIKGSVMFDSFLTWIRKHKAVCDV